MTVTEVLQAARDIIETPETWCQKHNAEDPDGGMCQPDEPQAVSWCANGAIARAARNPAVRMGAYDNLAFASLELFKCVPETVNDINGHDDVLRMYDRAIQISRDQIPRE